MERPSYQFTGAREPSRFPTSMGSSQSRSPFHYPEQTSLRATIWGPQPEATEPIPTYVSFNDTPLAPEHVRTSERAKKEQKRRAGFALSAAALALFLTPFASPTQAETSTTPETPYTSQTRAFWYDYGDPETARETGSDDITVWMLPKNGKKEYGPDDDRIIAKGLAEEADLGLAGRVISWDNPGGPRDKYAQEVGKVIKETGSNQKVILLLEGDGYGDPSEQTLDSELNYLDKKYFKMKWYARDRLIKQPIVQIYNSDSDYNPGYTDKYVIEGEKHGVTFQLKNFWFYSVGFWNRNYRKVQWIDYQPLWPRIETEDANIVADGFEKNNNPLATPKDYSLFRRNIRYSMHSGKPYLFIISRSEIWEHTALDQKDKQIVKEELAAAGQKQPPMLKPPSEPFNYAMASRRIPGASYTYANSNGPKKEEKPSRSPLANEVIILLNKRDEEEIESVSQSKAA